MLESVRGLQQSLRQLDKDLRQLRTVQVNKGSIQSSARKVIDHYFRDVRERIVTTGLTQTQLAGCDSMMQSLLEATHHRSTVQTYKHLVKTIIQELLVIEKHGLLEESAPALLKIDPLDQNIIATLKRLVPSAALSYEQAILDLQKNQRLSWRGPATDLREALRECLDHLAPDKDVEGQTWYKPDPQTNGPTMKQKVRYVLRSRGSSRSGMEAPAIAAEAVDEAVGSFVRSVYTRSNLSTHTPTNKQEVLRVRDWVRVTLCELLEIQS